MLRGLYTAASGMMSTITSLDAMSNNLSNIGTNGFKKSQVNFQSFPEMLIKRMSAGETKSIGGLMTGSKLRSTAISFMQGALTPTQNPLDFAIEGDGFFTVKGGDGQNYYTRNGAFTLSPDGRLTTLDGREVQGKNGAIRLEPGEQLHLSQTGEIVTSGGRAIDTLAIVRFNDNHSLERIGDSLYKMTPESRIQPLNPGENIKVHQGQIESANVNTITELVNSIAGLRQYEALQKHIQTQNDTLGKVVNEVGRYR
jgi:flagellar basal-body rod protein FlgG